MNLELLDIRYGRINRRQFLALYIGILLFDFAVWFFMYSLKLPYIYFDLAVCLPLITLYLIPLLFARRFRDFGSSGWIGAMLALGPFFIILISLIVYLIGLLFVSKDDLVFFPVTAYLGYQAVLEYGTLTVFSRFYSLIVFFLMFAPGDDETNQYGKPVTGFQFKTMVSKDFARRSVRSEIDMRESA